MYVVVLPATKSDRLDSNILHEVASIAALGRPTLICLNQFSRYLDWWDDAAEADGACEAIRKSVVERVPAASSFLQVFLTEFREYEAHLDQMTARNIKSVEHVGQSCTFADGHVHDVTIYGTTQCCLWAVSCA